MVWYTWVQVHAHAYGLDKIETEGVYTHTNFTTVIPA